MPYVNKQILLVVALAAFSLSGCGLGRMMYTSIDDASVRPSGEKNHSESAATRLMESAPSQTASTQPAPEFAVAEILSPQANATVGRNVEVRVRFGFIPEGSNFWVATVVDRLYWPKEPKLDTSRPEAAVTIAEGGDPPDRTFSLALVLVPPEGQRKIEEWTLHGKLTRKFPGLELESIPGAQVLDSVELKLR